MNWRRFFLALAVASVVTLTVDVLLNAVVFRSVYVRAAAHLLPADQLNTRVPLGWAALLVNMAAFAYVQIRGGWVGLSSGLRFGAIVAGASVAGVAGIASIVAWPTELLTAMAVQQAVNALLLAAVFGLMHSAKGSITTRSER